MYCKPMTPKYWAAKLFAFHPIRSFFELFLNKCGYPFFKVFCWSLHLLNNLSCQVESNQRHFYIFFIFPLRVSADLMHHLLQAVKVIYSIGEASASLNTWREKIKISLTRSDFQSPTALFDQRWPHKDSKQAILRFLRRARCRLCICSLWSTSSLPLAFLFLFLCLCWFDLYHHTTVDGLQSKMWITSQLYTRCGQPLLTFPCFE
mmetsp:Transcript_8553/g.13242  ORF Transcript_8553/g.13242 Transcript_8553/m.13242 type:complete len:205 (+) Transcript_8553:143-757(+)